MDDVEPRAIAPEDQELGATDRQKHWARVDARRRPPVQWLSPQELARTGIRAGQATMFGEFADKREVEAGLPAEYYDFSDANADDFWLDYVADIGDGFNATYAVANQLAQPQLTLGGQTTQRGKLLVLGGDEVYPVGSAKNYTDRTTGPFGAALPQRSPDSPAVLAVPGNHDWYDGLSAFLRVFCQSWLMDPRPPGLQPGALRCVPAASRTREFMGGWRSLQSRSYFAAKLPHNWWLWGIDIQFDTFIDAPQLSYFLDAAKLVGDGNIILCTAKPSWVDAAGEPESYDILRWFVRRTLGDHTDAVRLILSGDTHHYARYELTDEAVDAPHQLITCGGGGAYLSATHQLPDTLSLTEGFRSADDDPPPATYQRISRYPDADDSKKLARRQFGAIPHRNSRFSMLAGALYALFVLLATVAQQPVAGGFSARLQAFDVTQTRWAPPLLPAVLLAILIVAGMVGLAKPARSKPNRGRKIAAGVLHGLAHLVLALAIGTLIAAMPADLPDGWYGPLFTLVIAIVGGIAGSFLAALYLLLASGLARVNTNELYAGMQLEDRKSFLRLRVSAATRELFVYPVKVDDVPRRWKFNADGGPADALFAPDGEPLRSELIEDAIPVQPRTG